MIGYFKSKVVSQAQEISPKLRDLPCQLDAESSGLLERTMAELNLSERAHDRILKMSRIVANLNWVEGFGTNHLLEAIQYRTLDSNLWGRWLGKCM